jgi:hypothetical protein
MKEDVKKQYFPPRGETNPTTIATIPRTIAHVRPNFIAPSLFLRYSIASTPLVMESIAELDIELPRVVPVESAKGLTIVQVHTPVGYV